LRREFRGENILFNDRQTLIRKIRTNSQKVEYFGDDETDFNYREKIQNEYFYHDYSVNFSMHQYAEFFIIHLLAYTLLGPFINLYILLFPMNWHLMRNLMFLGCYPSFFVQHVIWAINFGMLLLYLKTFNGYSSIADLNAIITILIAQILRASSIAGKYATYPANLIRKLKKKTIPFKEIIHNLMLIGWLKQGTRIISAEIDSSLQRLDIDETMLKLTFIHRLSKVTIDDFEVIMKRHDKGHFDNVSVNQFIEKDLLFYDGKLIIEHLIHYFNRKNNLKISSMVNSVVICLILALLPGIIRVIHSQSFHGSNVLEVVLYYLNTVVNFLSFLSIVLFFDRAIVDLKRRHFMLQQLGQMMSPKKLSGYSREKIVPTIHLFDKISLRSWSSLRKLSMDYGKKFLIRHEIMIPVLFLISTTSIVCAVSLQFIPSMNELLVESSNLKLLFLIFFIFTFSLFVRLLYAAGSVNSHFSIHKHILRNNKEVYHDLRDFGDVYFRRYWRKTRNDEDKPSEGEREFTVGNIVKGDSESFVHRRLAREIYDLLGDKGEAVIEEFLENMIDICGKCIEDLIEEEKINSLKLLGFTVTKSGVTNLVIAYFSVIITAIQFLNN